VARHVGPHAGAAAGDDRCLSLDLHGPRLFLEKWLISAADRRFAPACRGAE
jgi:hypothetical protein